jgi:hypothetical protein
MAPERRIGLRQRPLGAGGPAASVIGFGAMVLSPGVYHDVRDDWDSAATLEAGLDSGVTLVDTADIYGTATTSGSSDGSWRRAGTSLCSPPSSVATVAATVSSSRARGAPRGDR